MKKIHVSNSGILVRWHKTFMCVITLCLASIHNPLFGSEASPFKPKIDLSTSFGVTIGESYEYVYSKNKILSELIWPFTPAPFFSTNLNFSWPVGLTIGGSFSSAFPGKYGMMSNSDSFNIGATGSTTRTHYSEHENWLDHKIDTEVELGWLFSLPLNGPASQKKITISPLVSFRYMMYKWAAKHGYTQYANEINGVYNDWSSSLPKTPFYGTGILYQQEWIMATLGLSVGVPISQKFLLSPSFAFAPYVWCNSLDNHLLRSLDFYDVSHGGFLISPSLSLSFELTQRASLKLLAEWNYASGLRGDTFTHSTYTNSWERSSAASGNGAGAALNATTIQLGFTTRLNQ